ncbi:hypothetical protein [Pedobacter gandavensis]|uniref:hypothetical protein n=1 Tax=Pedobacter gandavensis TaxID=2679963 RepID=UPI00292E5524|nr:hypothetical protein [Pedobacter gandavensis]
MIICLAMMLLSCKVMYGPTPKFTMGMSEKEFKEKNKSEMVLATEDGEKIFRMYNVLTDYSFFYFKNGKLVRFENGNHPDDYKFGPLL